MKCGPLFEGSFCLVALLHQLHLESAGLDAIIAAALAGSPRAWKGRLARAGNVHTYAMVDALIKRSEAIFSADPAAAVSTAALAVEIADALRIDAYPFDFVIGARARARFEHGFLLYYTGQLAASLSELDHAESLFQQVPLSEFQIARIWLVRAMIYPSIDRASDAISLANKAAEIFASYGDTARVIKARMTLAAMLVHVHRYGEALPICNALEQEEILRETTDYGIVLQNIGNCYRHLNQFDQADAYLARAVAEHRKNNATGERVRTEWSRASVLAASGRIGEALPLFRQTWEAFAQLGMETDAALTALELAEVLLATEQAEEVPLICRKLLDHFTHNDMTSRAVTALSFLREALAMRQATPSLVRHVADFIRELPAHPTLSFAPPPV